MGNRATKTIAAIVPRPTNFRASAASNPHLEIANSDARKEQFKFVFRV